METRTQMTPATRLSCSDTGKQQQSLNIHLPPLMMIIMIIVIIIIAYMQKTCDVAEMAILAKKIGGKSA